MKDLKTLLFEETQYYTKEYYRLKKEFGDCPDLVSIHVSIQQSKMKILYNLIIEAGLENEFIDWKED